MTELVGTKNTINDSLIVQDLLGRNGRFAAVLDRIQKVPQLVVEFSLFGALVALEFGLELVAALKGRDVAEKLRHGIIAD